MPAFEELKVFAGSAHKALAEDVCKYLGVPQGKAEVFKFSNDNTFVQFKENVRERDVFIIQPFSYPVNDHIMELLIMMDAARRASAGRITAVIPYYGYGRTDKKDQPRVPITARLVADLLTVAGANRVLTIDLHAGQVQGFFDIPVDELTALPLLAHYFQELNLDNPVVVAVDIGISKRARDMAAHLGAPLAIIEKRRTGNQGGVESLNIIGDVAGKVAITFDDEIDTASSLVSAIGALGQQGVRDVYACCTHPVFSGQAMQRLLDATLLKQVVVTDTLPINYQAAGGKVIALSIASVLGEAIHRIHSGLSVGAMFE